MRYRKRKKAVFDYDKHGEVSESHSSNENNICIDNGTSKIAIDLDTHTSIIEYYNKNTQLTKYEPSHLFYKEQFKKTEELEEEQYLKYLPKNMNKEVLRYINLKNVKKIHDDIVKHYEEPPKDIDISSFLDVVIPFYSMNNTFKTAYVNDLQEEESIISLDESVTNEVTTDECTYDVIDDSSQSMKSSSKDEILETEEEDDIEHFDSRTEAISKNKSYLLFLKKSMPNLYKQCLNTKDYIERVEKGLLERAERNKASSCKYEGSVKLEILKNIDAINKDNWTESDKKKLSAAIIKHKNDFEFIRQSFPGIPLSDIILKYYLMKNKTFSYLKKKPGRISDNEIKMIVENEWTREEMDIFEEKYKTVGKFVQKYQTWLNKTEKDLKIYLRYFVKIQGKKAEISKKSKRKNVSKSEILEDWNIDERQIFALYFPYFNKNWISMSTYFPSKNSMDLKLYYSKYYKHLSFNEQRFESNLQNINVLFKTDPICSIGDKDRDDLVSEIVGIIFKK